MSNADTPAAGGNLATPTSGNQLGELPPRVRVHALAKLLGLNSREVLAKLTELGEPARSAQSSVPRETAVRVADAFTGQPEPEPEPEPKPKPAPEPEPEPVSRPVAHAPVFAAPSPLFLPPEPPPARAEPPAPAPMAEDPAEEREAEPSEEEDLGRRRRRRGRRGRGRGKGGDEGTTTDEQSEETAKSDDDQATAESETPEEPEETEEADSTSRRRRRRRRRKSADEDVTESSDDPPNTVVHVREAKAEPEKKEGKDGKDGKSDGVRSVRGSTRLEAKRQRRRDGREAGRRRAPILSEAEFLARRESVERAMVVAERGENTQIAVLEDGVLVEHFVTSAGSGSIVGNVYLGRVQNVLPSMEAAFVDIGRGRNAVLYAGEVDWDAAGLEGKSRKIEQALSTGDNVLVQVTKDPVGHKGARLTTQISLPGRFLVYVPAGGATGISRKLPENERRRLKDILKRIVPEDAGVIIRTASEGISEEELERDVRRLKAQWEVIKGKADSASGKKAGAPTMLYEEPDLLVKVVRDLFTEDFSKLEVEGDTAWETINAYVQHVAADLVGRLKRYTGTGDVLADYRIDEQLTKALDRKVWLPSGGYLVIDRTEAMTVIDVNTGKFTGSGGNLEETVTRNNLESAEEIVRQLRLRDVGGIIVIDFIDMVLESNRELVLRRLTECLGRDRTRHQVAEVTSLGLVQMTRKKVGTGLLEAFSTTCEHCKGRGVVISTEPQRTGGGNGVNGGGHQHGSRRARGRGKAEETPAETRGESGPTPEQRESVVSAVQAMANASKLASSGKDHEKDHEPGEPAEPGQTAAETPETAEVVAEAEPAAETAVETAAETAQETAAETAVATAAEPAVAPRSEVGAETPATEPAAVTPSDATAETAEGAAEAPVETTDETPEPAPAVAETAVLPEPAEAQVASTEPEAAETEATSAEAVADTGPAEAALEEPVVAPEPEAPAEPESGTQPVTATWPGAATESTAASWPGASAEPQATAEAEATAEAGTPAEPEGAAEPEALVEPGAVVEPVAAAEPVDQPGAGTEPEAAGKSESTEHEHEAEHEPVETEPAGTVTEPSGTDAGPAGTGPGSSGPAGRPVRRRPRRVVSRPAGPPVHASDQS